MAPLPPALDLGCSKLCPSPAVSYHKKIQEKQSWLDTDQSEGRGQTPGGLCGSCSLALLCGGERKQTQFCHSASGTTDSCGGVGGEALLLALKRAVRPLLRE